MAHTKPPGWWSHHQKERERPISLGGILAGNYELESFKSTDKRETPDRMAAGSTRNAEMPHTEKERAASDNWPNSETNKQTGLSRWLRFNPLHGQE